MDMFMVSYTDIETDKYKILRDPLEGELYDEYFFTEEEAIITANKLLPPGTRFYVFAEINILHIVPG